MDNGKDRQAMERPLERPLENSWIILDLKAQALIGLAGPLSWGSLLVRPKGTGGDIAQVSDSLRQDPQEVEACRMLTVETAKETD